MSLYALDLLDPIRDAAIRGDVIRLHELLNAVMDAEPNELERMILDPSIAASLAILERNPQRHPRPLLDAVKTVAGVVLFGLACRSWMEMSW